jgi:hypothetical protein
MKNCWFDKFNTQKSKFFVEQTPDNGAIASREAILCLGSVNYINSSKQINDSSVLLLVYLQAIEDIVPSNTVYISFKNTESVKYKFVFANGITIKEGIIPINRIFSDMSIGTALKNDLKNSNVPYIDDLNEFVPLFYLSFEFFKDTQVELYKNIHIYSQVRFCIEDGLFIRTSSEPYLYVEADEIYGREMDLPEGKPLGWVHEALRLHVRNSLFLNNHQCYYKKCFPGKELENKFTLKAPVNTWGLTVEIYQKLRKDELKGYIMEYRDEFQQWDYINYLYEIPEPLEEQGYISFIPSTDGKVIVKRKHYNVDQFMRGEIQYKTSIDVPFEQYIKEKYGVTPVQLPPFRRVRYDVNFESTRTGHVYGIFFDHCSIIQSEDIILNQCEVEYLRSRTVLEPDAEEVLKEMEEITSWTRSFLKEKGICYREGYYSKLSFLRDNLYNMKI